MVSRECWEFARFALESVPIMNQEEVVVLRVLRFVIVASIAAALIWMAYKG